MLTNGRESHPTSVVTKAVWLSLATDVNPRFDLNAGSGSLTEDLMDVNAGCIDDTILLKIAAPAAIGIRNSVKILSFRELTDC